MLICSNLPAEKRRKGEMIRERWREGHDVIGSEREEQIRKTSQEEKAMNYI